LRKRDRTKGKMDRNVKKVDGWKERRDSDCNEREKVKEVV